MAKPKLYTPGSIWWGSLSQQAGIFADKIPPHRFPDPAVDSELDGLLLDYISKTPDGGFGEQKIQALLPGILPFDVLDLGGTKHLTFVGDSIVHAGTHGEPIPGTALLSSAGTSLQYWDKNEDFVWTSDEPIIYDADFSGTYSSGDTVLYGTAPPLGSILSQDGIISFWDFNGSTDYQLGEAVIIDADFDQLYTPFRAEFKGVTGPNFGPFLIYKGFKARGSSGKIGIIEVPSGQATSGDLYLLQLEANNSPYSGGAGKEFRYLSTGPVNIAANASAVFGLYFNPIVTMNAGVTLSEVVSVYGSRQIVGVVIGTNPTIAEVTNFKADAFDTFKTNITTIRQFWAKGVGGSSGTVTNAVGYDCEALGVGTNRWGFRQTGTDKNNYNGKTRYGDQTAPNNTLETAGGMTIGGVVTKTGNYTIVDGDYGILGDATAGNITITLPTAARTGMMVFLKKKDASANTVTVSRAGTDTIEGATTIVLANQNDSILLQADGSATWVRLDL